MIKGPIIDVEASAVTKPDVIGLPHSLICIGSQMYWQPNE